MTAAHQIDVNFLRTECIKPLSDIHQHAIIVNNTITATDCDNIAAIASTTVDLTAHDRIGGSMVLSFVWFFPPGCTDESTNESSLAQSTLQQSLAMALARFPSLVGKPNSKTPTHLTIDQDCTAHLHIATTNQDISDFIPEYNQEKGFTRLPIRPGNPNLASKFFPSTPSTIEEFIDSNIPLSSFTFLDIPSSNAFAIAIHISHLVSDGKTLDAFMKTWTEYNRQITMKDTTFKILINPMIPNNVSAFESHASTHPQVINNPVKYATGYRRILPTDPPLMPEPNPSNPPTPRIFHFSNNGLSILKNEITAALVKDNLLLPNEFVSTDDCLTAYIWYTISHLSTRNPNTVTSLHRTLNMRGFLNLDEETTGNLIYNTIVKAVPGSMSLPQLALFLRRELGKVTQDRDIVDNELCDNGSLEPTRQSQDRDINDTNIKSSTLSMDLRFLSSERENISTPLFFNVNFTHTTAPDLAISSWRAFTFDELQFGYYLNSKSGWFHADFSVPPFCNIGQIVRVGEDGGVCFQVALLEGEMREMEMRVLERRELLV
ncbi:hypothetical protein HDU76_002286 [Blyttiomyces sp. JEL0837]|nr:hypothetical protein HDU76_002286 [Blyttiomyces sp. JEL0837]